jgi:oligoribonuclease NrnB/cAMP/cGMP phosphodiesterase (DHH superfamily)
LGGGNEVFEGATVVEAILEAVDDFFVSDINYGRALVEQAVQVLEERLALFLLDHHQVHASTRAPHGAREVAGEWCLQLVPLVYRVLVK